MTFMIGDIVIMVKDRACDSDIEVVMGGGASTRSAHIEFINVCYITSAAGQSFVCYEPDLIWAGWRVSSRRQVNTAYEAEIRSSTSSWELSRTLTSEV